MRRGRVHRRVVVVSFQLVALPLDEANAFVSEHHRHHQPVVGHKFSIGAAVDGEITGVAIVGRPVARGYDNGTTLEVVRCCTDGTRNACSWLYTRCWRATEALGYQKIITYTLASESGASLRGAGWTVIGQVRGRSWSCDSRPRVDKHPLQDKFCWAPTETTTSDRRAGS